MFKSNKPRSLPPSIGTPFRKEHIRKQKIKYRRRMYYLPSSNVQMVAVMILFVLLLLTLYDTKR